LASRPNGNMNVGFKTRRGNVKWRFLCQVKTESFARPLNVWTKLASCEGLILNWDHLCIVAVGILWAAQANKIPVLEDEIDVPRTSDSFLPQAKWVRFDPALQS
jgi:hypothetical protein